MERRFVKRTDSSQSGFERLIGVSVKTLQNWEAGPPQAALRFKCNGPRLLYQCGYNERRWTNLRP